MTMSLNFIFQNKKLKWLIFGLIVLGGALFFFQITHGQEFGQGIADAALEGVEEFAAPIIKWLHKIAWLYLLSFVALFIAGQGLHFVISNPQWINFTQTGDMGFAFVEAGANFTLALARLICIIILVIIGISTILKIETFAAKKTLPRLIVVLLLLNFYRVLVGFVVDIANIINAGLIEALGRHTTWQFILRVTQNGWGALQALFGWLTLYGGTMLLPHVAPGIQFLFILLVTILVLPSIFIGFLHIIINFSLASTLFTFFIILLSRIFVIWILAILAPLAMVAAVLPNTQRYWEQWKKLLFEWSFISPIILFFLALGLRAVAFGDQQFVNWRQFPVSGFPSAPAWFFYYFFIIVYFVVALFFVRKYAPEMAAGISDAIKGAGSYVWARGLKPLGGALLKESQRTSVAQRKTEEEAGRMRRDLTPTERVGRAVARPVRWGHRYFMGTTPEKEVSKDVEKRAAEIEKRFGKDTRSAMDVLGPAWNRTDEQTRAAAALYLAKTGGAEGLRRIIPEAQLRGLSEARQNELILQRQREVVITMATYASHKVEDIVKHAPELIDDREVGERVRGAMVNRDDFNRMRRIYPELGEEEVRRRAAYRKAVESLKPEDIDVLREGTLRNENFQRATLLFGSPAILRRIGEEKGYEYTHLLDQRAIQIREEIEQINPRLLVRAREPGWRWILPGLAEEIRRTPVQAQPRIVLPEEISREEQERLRREKGPSTPPTTPTPPSPPPSSPPPTAPGRPRPGYRPPRPSQPPGRGTPPPTPPPG